jgi:hypothetical protein
METESAVQAGLKRFLSFCIFVNQAKADYEKESHFILIGIPD